MAVATEVDTLTFRDVCRDVLDEGGSAKPHSDENIEAVLDRLDEDQMLEAAEYGVKTALHLMGRSSKRSGAKAQRNRQGTGKGGSRARTRSARHESATETAASHEGVFGRQLFVGTDRPGTDEGWKYLGDCDKADLIACAELMEAKASADNRKAGTYRTLAGKLKGKQVVSKLAEAVVEETLDAE